MVAWCRVRVRQSVANPIKRTIRPCPSLLNRGRGWLRLLLRVRRPYRCGRNDAERGGVQRILRARVNRRCGPRHSIHRIRDAIHFSAVRALGVGGQETPGLDHDATPSTLGSTLGSNRLKKPAHARRASRFPHQFNDCDSEPAGTRTLDPRIKSPSKAVHPVLCYLFSLRTNAEIVHCVSRIRGSSWSASCQFSCQL